MDDKLTKAPLKTNRTGRLHRVSATVTGTFNDPMTAKNAYKTIPKITDIKRNQLQLLSPEAPNRLPELQPERSNLLKRIGAVQLLAIAIGILVGCIVSFTIEYFIPTLVNGNLPEMLMLCALIGALLGACFTILPPLQLDHTRFALLTSSALHSGHWVLIAKTRTKAQRQQIKKYLAPRADSLFYSS